MEFIRNFGLDFHRIFEWCPRGLRVQTRAYLLRWSMTDALPLVAVSCSPLAAFSLDLLSLWVFFLRLSTGWRICHKRGKIHPVNDTKKSLFLRGDSDSNWINFLKDGLAVESLEFYLCENSTDDAECWYWCFLCSVRGRVGSPGRSR